MQTSAKLASRMEQRRAELRLTIANAARRMTNAKPSPSSFHHWETGQRKPHLDYIVEIAEALEVSPAWLLGFTDDMQGSGSKDLYATFPDADAEPNGREPVQIKSDRSLKFSEGLLSQHNMSANNLVLLSATDSTMGNVIRIGDLVLVDRNQTIPDKIDTFALLVNDRVWFRWIRPEFDGSFTIFAEDESKTPSTSIPAEKLQSLCILGRVAAITRFQ